MKNMTFSTLTYASSSKPKVSELSKGNETVWMSECPAKKETLTALQPEKERKYIYL